MTKLEAYKVAEIGLYAPLGIDVEEYKIQLKMEFIDRVSPLQFEVFLDVLEGLVMEIREDPEHAFSFLQQGEINAKVEHIHRLEE